MEQLEEKLILMESLLDDDNWEIIGQTDDIITQKKFIPDINIACFKSTGIINAYPSELMAFVWNICKNEQNMKRNDGDILKYQIIKNLDSDTRICHQINKLPWPFWNRDVVYLQMRIHDDSRSAIIMYSIDYECIPEQNDKSVRAKINILSYVFEPCTRGCKVSLIVHVDPGGNIPAGIVNSYTGKTYNMIKKMMYI